PDLQIQQNAYQIALQATHEKDWESSPSVDLVGAYSHDRMSGSGSYGGSSTTLNNGVVGLQLTIPIYSGGMRSAQHNEQVRLEDQKLNEVIATRRQVHLAVQQAWMGYWTDIKKVNALELSVKASTERLDSTKLGFSIGDKTTLDVLNAQTDKTQGYTDWLLARQDLIDHWMDLMALTGMLAPESLVQVDQLLEKTPISLGSLLQESEVNSITKGE
ncbi:MAG: TolC family protein, partial [Ferrovum sp.]|nr:TolC family protein [Ferrovum sp.]